MDPTTSSSVPRFVAVGENAQRLISDNGIDWHDQQLGKEGEIYRSVCYGNGRYVTVGTYGGDSIFASSENGKDWKTDKRDAHYSSYTRTIVFGNNQFLAAGGDPGAVGDSRPFVIMSPDGIKWGDTMQIAGKNILRRFAWGNGRFVGVGDRGRRATSKDGKLWEDAPDTKAIDTLVDVAFGKGLFVGVGLNGLRMRSEDGVAWTQPLRGEEGEHCNSIVFAGDQFVAIGQGATYFSPDGIEWKRVENKDYPLIAAYGNGTFIGAAWKGRLLASTDAITWKQTYKSDYYIESICAAGQ